MWQQCIKANSHIGNDDETTSAPSSDSYIIIEGTSSVQSVTFEIKQSLSKKR